jgi:hypothetical protein
VPVRGAPAVAAAPRSTAVVTGLRAQR